MHNQVDENLGGPKLIVTPPTSSVPEPSNLPFFALDSDPVVVVIAVFLDISSSLFISEDLGVSQLEPPHQHNMVIELMHMDFDSMTIILLVPPISYEINWIQIENSTIS
ncbi:hypothetical protein OUZ56_010524 [Daphnia magna]|uniref:Uncharacterized protein n=1 Tax=Daphnia magna TaxID=35525 RepID=A0ABR0AJ67_9CRUS|nr:hypothetical protein OUZ56_010524 [Daphnia magna]